LVVLVGPAVLAELAGPVELVEEAGLLELIVPVEQDVLLAAEQPERASEQASRQALAKAQLAEG
jgi:hypothetical protein